MEAADDEVAHGLRDVLIRFDLAIQDDDPARSGSDCCCRQPQNLLILSMKNLLILSMKNLLISPMEKLKDPARITKSSHRDPHGRRQLTRG
jgi:hypothetical protein